MTTEKQTKDKCDCLNDCGDDSRVKDGTCEPCPDYARLHRYDSAECDAARFRWLCDHLSRDEFSVPQGADPYRYMADFIDLHRANDHPR